MQYAYYPGCSLGTSARMYETSLHKVMGLVDVELVEIDDWSCCGASSAHVLDTAVATGLAARNLGLAEKLSMDLVTGCASCFFRLRAAEAAMKSDADLAAYVNGALAAPYEGRVRIRNTLDVLLEVLEGASPRPPVRRHLRELRPVCYYGCLFGRAAGDQSYDDPENPTAMERLLASAGIEARDWSGKIDCCGASAAVIAPETATALGTRLLEWAREWDANAIVTACPMCQLNLDMGQYRRRSDPNAPVPLPVYFITQILGLAYGFSAEEMEIDRLLVPSLRLESLAGVKETARGVEVLADG